MTDSLMRLHRAMPKKQCAVIPRRSNQLFGVNEARCQPPSHLKKNLRGTGQRHKGWHTQSATGDSVHPARGIVCGGTGCLGAPTAKKLGSPSAMRWNRIRLNFAVHS